jgi:hypothetical protein
MEHWRKLTHLPTGRVDILYLLEQVGATEIYGPVGDQMYRGKRAAKRSHDRTPGVSISLGLTPSSDFHPDLSSFQRQADQKELWKDRFPMNSTVATCQARADRFAFPFVCGQSLGEKHCLKGIPLNAGTAEHGFWFCQCRRRCRHDINGYAGSFPVGSSRLQNRSHFLAGAIAREADPGAAHERHSDYCILFAGIAESSTPEEALV